MRHGRGPGAAGRRCAWPRRSWTPSATCGTPGRSCASARRKPPTSWPRCRRARCCPGLPSHCVQAHRTLRTSAPAGRGRAGGLQEGAGEGGGRVRAGRARVPHRLGAAGPHGARPGPHGGRGPPQEVPAAVRGAPARRPRPARAGHRSLPGAGRHKRGRHAGAVGDALARAQVRKRKWDSYCSGEELFGLPVTQYEGLQQTERELALLNRLYSCARAPRACCLPTTQLTGAGTGREAGLTEGRAGCT